MQISRLHIASRVAAGIGGGYVFVWGFVMLVIAMGLTAGMRYSEAQTLAFLLAFLVFLVAFCWAFAARSLVRVWCVLAGGGLAMTAAAWFTTRAIA
jgi:hypothetical protein